MILPVVVVGAGAAGLVAAGFAAEGGRPVLTLERSRDGGRKILISGGGRCNVLPSALDPGLYHTASSANTLRKMLLSWPLAEQRRFFEHRLGIPLQLEPETGKLFPASNRARDVRDGLVAFARDAGATIRFGTSLRDLVPPPHGGAPWRLVLDGGEEIEAAAVILATGGLSVPQTGSDGTGLAIAGRLGHTVHETYPALTPLLADPPRHAGLAGVSLPVRLAAPRARGAARADGGFLFTHRGYSGPSVLDISHHAVLAARERRQQPIQVQWTPMDDEAWDRALRGTSGATAGSLLRRHLPARLAEQLLEEAATPPERPLSQLRREERACLVELLARYPLPWTGDEGYRKAEVTGGGISLAEVDPRTLASRIHPGLHLCGEILDAFGPIGGYNFAWAWATGRTAGMGIAKSEG